MTSTPKNSNKIITSEMDQKQTKQPIDTIDSTLINNGKVNIMSQDFGQYIEMFTGSPQTKSGAYDVTSINEWFDDDLTNYLKEDYLLPESSEYDVSPLLGSSMTTPSLVLDNPQELDDSPLFSSVPASFSASPSQPTLGFFPDLSGPNAATVPTRSFIRQLPITPSVPSVTIPADDPSPLTSVTSVNIPWSTDVTNSSTLGDILQNTSSGSPLLTLPGTIPISQKSSPNVEGSVTMSPSSSSTSTSSSPLTNKSTGRSRKRSIGELEKDPQLAADELALKRAKNTDAARRSRLRKVMKMESLEKQVADLKIENNDLQTRVAVLESEKKGLEDKNVEKDARVKMLEQQLAEAHERLIKRA